MVKLINANRYFLCDDHCPVGGLFVVSGLEPISKPLPNRVSNRFRGFAKRDDEVVSKVIRRGGAMKRGAKTVETRRDIINFRKIVVASSSADRFWYAFAFASRFYKNLFISRSGRVSRWVLGRGGFS